MTFTSTPITLKDSAAADKSIIAFNDGTSSAFAHPLLDNAGAIISPATAGNQTAGNASLTAIATQTAGLATAAAQLTANASLASIASSLTAVAANNAPVAGVIPLTVGVTATAGRSVCVTCTQAGNVSFLLADGSTSIRTVGVGETSYPFQVTKVNSAGTTAVATYENWK